jgi:hypothetical protein
VTPLQLAWSELVRRRPRDARLLAAGALGNAMIAAVWTVSRTGGLPVGPRAGEAEPVGVKDLVATVDELMCALVVALILARARWGMPVAPAWALAAASVVGRSFPPVTPDARTDGPHYAAAPMPGARCASSRSASACRS